MTASRLGHASHNEKEREPQRRLTSQGIFGLAAVPPDGPRPSPPPPGAKMGRPRCELCRRKPRRRHECTCTMKVGTGCCWDAENRQCKQCHRDWTPLRTAAFGLPLELRLVLRRMDAWMSFPGPERRNRCGEPCGGRKGSRVLENGSQEVDVRFATRCLGVCRFSLGHGNMFHQCVRCDPKDSLSVTKSQVLPWNRSNCGLCLDN